MSSLVNTVIVAILAIAHLDKLFGFADRQGPNGQRSDLQVDHSEPETDPEEIKRLREFKRLSEMDSMGRRTMEQFDSRAQTIEVYSKRSTSIDAAEIESQQQRLTEIRNSLSENLKEQEALVRLVLKLEEESLAVEGVEDQLLELRVAVERILNSFDKALVMMADRVILSKVTIDLDAAKEALVATVERARGARAQLC